MTQAVRLKMKTAFLQRFRSKKGSLCMTMLGIHACTPLTQPPAVLPLPPGYVRMLEPVFTLIVVTNATALQILPLHMQPDTPVCILAHAPTALASPASAPRPPPPPAHPSAPAPAP